LIRIDAKEMARAWRFALPGCWLSTKTDFLKKQRMEIAFFAATVWLFARTMLLLTLACRGNLSFLRPKSRLLPR